MREIRGVNKYQKTKKFSRKTKEIQTKLHRTNRKPKSTKNRTKRCVCSSIGSVELFIWNIDISMPKLMLL